MATAPHAAASISFTLFFFAFIRKEYYLWKKYTHRSWSRSCRLWINNTRFLGQSLPRALFQPFNPTSREERLPGREPCSSCLDLRLLLASVWLEQNEIDQVGPMLAKQWKIRDCCADIFTKTCLHSLPMYHPYWLHRLVLTCNSVFHFSKSTLHDTYVLCVWPDQAGSMSENCIT